MAETIKAVMTFLDEEGKAITFSYSNVKATVNQAKVTAAMNAFVANGSVFKRVPVSKKSFIIVQTTKTEKSVE